MSQVELREYSPDYASGVLTDLQLQSKVGHFAHLAAILPHRHEKQAAAEEGLPYLQELQDRSIPPPDFSQVKIRAAENSSLWGREIICQAQEDMKYPRALKPSRRN